MISDNLPELRSSNDARDEVAELLQRLDEDGSLYFRRLLDPDRLLNLRREMLTVMQAGGCIVEGATLSMASPIPPLVVQKAISPTPTSTIRFTSCSRFMRSHIATRDPASDQRKTASTVLATWTE